MNIAVIGTGYVGLVTGTCFAEMGNNVICVDINEQKVNSLKSGKLTIFEPDLELIYERNLKQGRLQFTTSLEEAVENSKVLFLALSWIVFYGDFIQSNMPTRLLPDRKDLLLFYCEIISRSGRGLFYIHREQDRGEAQNIWLIQGRIP